MIFTLVGFAWRAAARRTRASVILLGVAVVLGAVQIWFIAQDQSSPKIASPLHLTNLVANTCFRLPCDLFFGTWIGPETGKTIIVVLGVGLLAFIAFAASRPSPHRPTMIGLLAFVAALLGVTALRTRFDLWGYGDIANGDRYFFIPKVVLLWICGMVSSSQRNRAIRPCILALLAMGLATNAPRFRFASYHDYGWYSLCPAISSGQEVEVMINPGWKFRYQRGSHASAGPL